MVTNHTNSLIKPIYNFFERCENLSHKSIDEVTTTKGKIKIAAGLGFGIFLYQFNTLLLPKIIKVLDLSQTLPDPFGDQNISLLALLSPIACLIGPIVEEIAFRGGIQETLCDKFGQIFYKHRGVSDYMNDVASRATSLFFTSIIFAGVHLLNALFTENRSAVYSQTVISLWGGLILGTTKELSGGLLLPIGIHVGNNIAAWATNIQYAWSRA